MPSSQPKTGIFNLNTNDNCPLCLADGVVNYFKDVTRNYYQCVQCDLVFVDRQSLPTLEQETQIYDLHQNSIDDQDYVTFLNRTILPLQAYLKVGMRGLDFGCGPAPVLAETMKKLGYSMKVADPIYFPRAYTTTEKYDFISCTEAIEHFHYPYREWQLWLKLLNPLGILAIMTKRVISQERFANWHYKNDPTHVCFYSDTTFNWLAAEFGFNIKFVDKDVVLMLKQKA